MKRRDVIEITTESYMEEQFIIDRLPDAVWLNMRGRTTFYLPIEYDERVSKALSEWKEIEEKGYETY